MKAPFPYFGSKSRVAEEIWKRLGDPKVYVEPFAGSLAVLLYKETPCDREIICDNNGFVVNFWRALRAEPQAVAYWADYPTYHQDLTARHKWLILWGREHSDKLSNDAEWYDAKAAGWWVWGISNWIGSGWCIDRGDVENSNEPKVDNIRVHIKERIGGQGVQAQRKTLPKAKESIPYAAHIGGQGIQVNKIKISEQIPNVSPSTGGKGVQVQKQADEHIIGSGDRLINWFDALAQRLSKVILLNRDWTEAVKPNNVTHGTNGSKYDVGVFLDPPYKTDKRSNGLLYQSDQDETSDNIALDSYLWAIENGDRYRIAYCCHSNDFEIPEGWTAIDKTFSSYKRKSDTKDWIMFSPACISQDEEERPNQTLL